MGTLFQPVRPGEPFDTSPARANASREALEYVRRMSHGFECHERTPFGVNPCIVSVKNLAKKNLDRFAVVGIDKESIFPDPTKNNDAELEFQRDPVFSVVVPKDEHAGNFLILASSLAYNSQHTEGVGKAYAAGVCRVRLKVTSGEEDYEYADIKPGETGYLVPKPSGLARILWKDPQAAYASTPVWACVMLCAGAPDDEPAFKLKEPLPLAASGTEVSWVRAWRGVFDPSWNGDYSYPETEENEIWVGDLRRLGFSGKAGMVGSCRMRKTKNGEVGEITDLRCVT